LAACIKCGQCVQVCPVSALKLADLGDGFGIGAPYIDARAQACDFSCDAVQCILACPTGALTYHKPADLPTRQAMQVAAAPVLLAKKQDPEPTLNLKERMGIARLTTPDRCLARLGKGHRGPAREAGFSGQMRFMSVDRWKPIPLNDQPFEVEICDLCVRTCPIEGAIRMVALDAQRWTPEVLEPCLGCGVCEMACPTEPASITILPREGWPHA
jgi:ferredoxin-type protein NapG